MDSDARDHDRGPEVEDVEHFEAKFAVVTQFASMDHTLYDMPRTPSSSDSAVAAGQLRIYKMLSQTATYVQCGSFVHPILPRSRVWRTGPDELVLAQPRPGFFWRVKVNGAVSGGLQSVLSKSCRYLDLRENVPDNVESTLNWRRRKSLSPSESPIQRRDKEKPLADVKQLGLSFTARNSTPDSPDEFWERQRLVSRSAGAHRAVPHHTSSSSPLLTDSTITNTLQSLRLSDTSIELAQDSPAAVGLVSGREDLKSAELRLSPENLNSAALPLSPENLKSAALPLISEDLKSAGLPLIPQDPASVRLLPNPRNPIEFPPSPLDSAKTEYAQHPLNPISRRTLSYTRCNSSKAPTRSKLYVDCASQVPDSRSEKGEKSDSPSRSSFAAIHDASGHVYRSPSTPSTPLLPSPQSPKARSQVGLESGYPWKMSSVSSTGHTEVFPFPILRPECSSPLFVYTDDWVQVFLHPRFKPPPSQEQIASARLRAFAFYHWVSSRSGRLAHHWVGEPLQGLLSWPELWPELNRNSDSCVTFDSDTSSLDTSDSDARSDVSEEHNFYQKLATVTAHVANKVFERLW